MKARHLLCCLLLACLSAGGQDTNLLSKLEPVPPFPELRTAATAAGIPLDGIVPAAPTSELSPGDSLTALITLHQKGNRRTEWLVYFQVIALTNGSSAKPPKPEVLYNSTGDKFEFASSPVMFRIRTLGPFVEAASFSVLLPREREKVAAGRMRVVGENHWGKPMVKDNTANASVNGTFLSFGLDQGAVAIHRLTLAHDTNFNYWVTDHPPSDKEMKKNQKLAAAFNMTPEEKRALAGWFPALMSYFTAVGETPDLDTIMWKVVSLPSLWSIVRHVGVTAWISMDFDNVSPFNLPANWGLPDGSRVFTLPLLLELNQQPALSATLFVTGPRPSFLVSGGIVGFVARNPNDDENYLTLRVISTRWGTEEKGK